MKWQIWIDPDEKEDEDEKEDKKCPKEPLWFPAYDFSFKCATEEYMMNSGDYEK